MNRFFLSVYFRLLERGDTCGQEVHFYPCIISPLSDSDYKKFGKKFYILYLISWQGKQINITGTYISWPAICIYMYQLKSELTGIPIFRGDKTGISGLRLWAYWMKKGWLVIESLPVILVFVDAVDSVLETFTVEDSENVFHKAWSTSIMK